MHTTTRRCLTVASACMVLLAWTSLAEAKRFKRYPGDAEPQQQGAPSPTVQSDPEAVAEPAEDGGGYEAEEAPGLFGCVPHGSGGLTVEYIYTGDVFTNMRGGINTRSATEYLGLFDLALTADLDQMGLLPGGTVFLLAEDFHGQGISARHVGDFQGIDNIDPGRTGFQMSEFWWERGICDGMIRVRIGKQDANAEFGFVELGGDFIHASFGMHPNIPMPAWPDQAMGAITFFQITEWLMFDIGVFDGAADGRTWGFSGTGETFTMGQLNAEWGFLGGRLPGDFHVGLWYHSGRPEDPGDPAVTFAGNHGVQLCLDQMIYKESCCDDEDDQGLGLFAQYGWAPEDRNEVPHYLGGGLVYKGLVPGRDDDFLGLGMAHVIFSNRRPNPDYETAIELFYKAQVNPWIVIQPDLQFIANPDGNGRDAFVAGLRFETVL